MLSTIAEIIRDLLIFVGVVAALLIALIVVVSMVPNTNPLKRVLTALCYRLGATLAAGAVAIPLEPIPGIDLLYDIGIPIVLLWYWYTFFRNARRLMFAPARQADHRQVTMGVDNLITGGNKSVG
jgi:hypothetical protein